MVAVGKEERRGRLHPLVDALERLYASLKKQRGPQAHASPALPHPLALPPSLLLPLNEHPHPPNRAAEWAGTPTRRCAPRAATRAAPAPRSPRRAAARASGAAPSRAALALPSMRDQDGGVGVRGSIAVAWMGGRRCELELEWKWERGRGSGDADRLVLARRRFPRSPPLDSLLLRLPHPLPAHHPLPPPLPTLLARHHHHPRADTQPAPPGGASRRSGRARAAGRSASACPPRETGRGPDPDPEPECQRERRRKGQRCCCCRCYHCVYRRAAPRWTPRRAAGRTSVPAAGRRDLSAQLDLLWRDGGRKRRRKGRVLEVGRATLCCAVLLQGSRWPMRHCTGSLFLARRL